MKDINIKQKIKATKNLHVIVARVLLIAMICALMMPAVSVNADSSTALLGASNYKYLLNGGFEEGQTWSDTYKQIDQALVPAWNTTAFDGRIELFHENTGVYFKNKITLIPSEGALAAELNADEESTLYQNVKTLPSSVYQWGLDHGARNGTDTMALIIGPKQSIDPSKTGKNGRDQLMQMVDWLMDQGLVTNKTSAGLGEQLVVYSKKFGANGTFEDNAGNNAFSLIPSTIYTEKWQIWIMASNCATTGTNPWNSYGYNAEKTDEISTESNDGALDLSKYYLYFVPSGQTETLFGFVSVGFKDSNGTAGKEKTYGNFIDNIEFTVYQPLSGSTTTHGSAVISGSDGTSGGVGDSEGYEITVDEDLVTYVKDGEPLILQAVVKKADAESGCEFVGTYYINQDENGNSVTNFLQLAENEIEDSESLTDEEKKGKWIKSINSNGDVVYTYYLDDVLSPTDLHFVFIKNPTLTYDSNGGKEYVVEREYNTSEAKNVYSFKPATGSDEATANTHTMFIDPYVSKAAEGQNDGWKFMGWLLTGDTIENLPEDAEKINADKLGSLLLPAEHTVACNFHINDASQASAAQQFDIYNGSVNLTKSILTKDDGEVEGVNWVNNGETKTYANMHKGLTMVAQWRWRQAFIPQVGRNTTFTDSETGGTVEITSVTDKTDSNYDASYNANGGKAYYSSTDETITATATSKEGYTFEGWYDADGNLITTNTTYSYIVTKESVNTCYARFSDNVTQTYIRQVKVDGTWKTIEDDKIATLGRYFYIDAVGMPISSTATAGTGYKFIGWYDVNGNKVADDMLTNNGATISYITTGNATYFARFESAYNVNFVAQTKQADDSFKNDSTGGNVSPVSFTDIAGTVATSKATPNSGYKFLGWYDASGSLLTTENTYSLTITSAINGVTYYARFESLYHPVVESKTYLSFVAESENTVIPAEFDGRDAGTGKNAAKYGLENKYGNTISTGFIYRIDDMTDVKTIQISVKVPDNAFVKVGSNGTFTGNGNAILTDSETVVYNKGSIQQIDSAKTLTYYWDALGLKANTNYGFIIDQLYAPGATATITVNGTEGTKVTNSNGVVNTSSADYKDNSHYPK